MIYGDCTQNDQGRFVKLISYHSPASAWRRRQGWRLQQNQLRSDDFQILEGFGPFDREAKWQKYPAR